MTIGIGGVVCAAAFVASIAAAQHQTIVGEFSGSAAGGDNLGTSVAIDGDTIVAGAPNADPRGNNSGAAHVFRWDGKAWNEEAKLVPSDGSASDVFGTSVDISGDVIVVGAYADDTGLMLDHGAAYVFVRTGTTWVQQAKLTALDAKTNDVFGLSVAVSGATIVCGAYGADIAGKTNAGAAYVFERTGTTWAQTAKLIASDGSIADRFGYDVDIDGDRIISGAWGDDVGSATDCGSFYIFDRLDGLWQQVGTGPAGQGFDNGDGLGIAVALSGDRAAAGAPHRNSGEGFCAVYERRSSGTWFYWSSFSDYDEPSGNSGWSVAITPRHAFAGAPGAASGAGGAVGVVQRRNSNESLYQFLRDRTPAIGDSFGFSIAASGSVVVIGSPFENTPSTDVGRIHVFYVADDAVVRQYTSLGTASTAGDGMFGSAVAAATNLVVVGAPDDDVGAANAQGKARVFELVDHVWTETAVLTANNGDASDRFGAAAAIGGSTSDRIIWIGAPGDETAANQSSRGSVYAFKEVAGVWTQVANLMGSTTNSSDQFGFAIATSGNTAYVGAPFSAGVGKVYEFRYADPTWSENSIIDAPSGYNKFGSSLTLGPSSSLLIGAPGAGSAVIPGGAVHMLRFESGAWVLKATMTPHDPHDSGGFGTAISYRAGILAIGDPAFTTPQASEQGAAYVFEGLLTGFAERQQLLLTDPEPADHFGCAVAVGSDSIAVGAEVGGVQNYGSVTWFAGPAGGMRAVHIVESTSLSSELGYRLGAAMAWTTGSNAQGERFVIGAPLGYINSHRLGRAVIYDYSSIMSRGVSDVITGETYSSLPDAILASADGDALIANAGAFWDAGSINFAGRAIEIESHYDMMNPRAATITLADGAMLSSPIRTDMHLNGTVRVDPNAAAQLSAPELTLGSGLLSLGLNAGLFVDSPRPRIVATTQLGTGASLSFISRAHFTGPVTLGPGSLLSTVADTTFDHSLSATDAQLFAGPVTLRGVATLIESDAITGPLLIASPLAIDDAAIISPQTTVATRGSASGQGSFYGPVTNRGVLTFTDTSHIIGDVTNESGATIRILQGTLFFTGVLTNNGTITGETCCRSEPEIDMTGPFAAAADASLLFAGPMKIRCTDRFDVAINDSERCSLRSTSLVIDGRSGPQDVEALSADEGPIAAALDAPGAGRFPLGALVIESGAAAALVDVHDNDNSIATGAVYAELVHIKSGATLINDAAVVYYRSLILEGAVTAPANLVRIDDTCAADLNSDGFVNGDDADLFLSAFELGGAFADFDGNGFVNGDDYDAFVAAFEQGC